MIVAGRAVGRGVRVVVLFNNVVRALLAAVDEAADAIALSGLCEAVSSREFLPVVLTEDSPEGLREMVVRRVRRVVLEILLDGVTEVLELRPRRDWVGRA